MENIAPANPGSELLLRAQHYLCRRLDGKFADKEAEAAWIAFFQFYSRKIRNYAFACGASEEDISDCIQEVWTELLVRLPTFQLDLERGNFDTWLYQVVRSKTVNLCRSRNRCFLQETSDTLQSAIDHRSSAVNAVDEQEFLVQAWNELSTCMSECNLQILHMRIAEQCSVAEVAEQLGLSREQVWYRYHRARREAEHILAPSFSAQATPKALSKRRRKKKEKIQGSAQGKTTSPVSRIVGPRCQARQGASCVDYIFQRLELGRRELTPEWKIEWNCDDSPRPVLYFRKSAIVAYAEICGPENLVNGQWPRIVNSAIAAGVSAGVATIIATPTAALPVFQTEFHKHFLGKGGCAGEEKIQVALSARQEANGPWCACKN